MAVEAFPSEVSFHTAQERVPLLGHADFVEAQAAVGAAYTPSSFEKIFLIC